MQSAYKCNNNKMQFYDVHGNMTFKNMNLTAKYIFLASSRKMQIGTQCTNKPIKSLPYLTPLRNVLVQHASHQ